MKSSPPLKQPVSSVAELIKLRLAEVKRTAEELATAVEVPTKYIEDIIAGRRRPPMPGRTDLYERMTPFLRLGRNDLVTCARAERAKNTKAGRGPHVAVSRLLLAMCEAATAAELERRKEQNGNAELAGLTQRLLDVTQGAVARMLFDHTGLRIAATQHGSSYLAMRFKVLEFLDASPETLTTDDVTEFIQPRLSMWDVDLESGVLRVVLRTQESRERGGRRPDGGSGSYPWTPSVGES